jgi:hypothetical protein
MTARGVPPVSLVRSGRRRRTYKWSLVDGRVQLEVPRGLSGAEEARISAKVAEQARRRLARAERASDEQLLQQARELASRHVRAALPRLRSVAWSDRQGHRWGSCTSETGAIRLSSRLHDLPNYVLDAVLVHELAHLLEPNHSARFHQLASTYPLAERARGFLEAVDRRLGTAGDAWAEGLD